MKVKPKAPAAVETTKTKKAAQLDEFMEVMQPRTKKGPSWANEPAEPALAPESKRDKKSKTRTPTSAEVQPEEVAVSPDDDRGEGMSDLDWMKRRMSKAAEAGEDDDARAFVQSDDEAVDDDKPEVTLASQIFSHQRLHIDSCILSLRARRLRKNSIPLRRLFWRRHAYSFAISLFRARKPNFWNISNRTAK